MFDLKLLTLCLLSIVLVACQSEGPNSSTALPSSYAVVSLYNGPVPKESGLPPKTLLESRSSAALSQHLAKKFINVQSLQTQRYGSKIDILNRLRLFKQQGIGQLILVSVKGTSRHLGRNKTLKIKTTAEIYTVSTGKIVSSFGVREQQTTLTGACTGYCETRTLIQMAEEQSQVLAQYISAHILPEQPSDSASKEPLTKAESPQQSSSRKDIPQDIFESLIYGVEFINITPALFEILEADLKTLDKMRSLTVRTIKRKNTHYILRYDSGLSISQLRQALQKSLYNNNLKAKINLYGNTFIITVQSTS
ncbi:hypothetical protein QGN29_10455 [Temperatibacter marinus]|uniref:FlgO domain-containing protein n=1 Tax=Temperatibacter marinus TaxID=1456591 RepID=A0AA52EG93_9PROT|nr:hypothetical protein [Temperatibacter marinus]WND01969.1 hypothetical protein QGN29_10455 [Temperatibacter marinus]